MGGKLSNEYEITNMSGFAAEIKDVVLDADDDVETRTTRRVIKAKIVDNADKSIRRVNITLAHQRRHKKADDWQDVDSFALSSIKGGEEAKIHLDAKETYELFTALQDLYAISATGVPNNKGTTVICVGRYAAALWKPAEQSASAPNFLLIEERALCDPRLVPTDFTVVP